MECGKIRKGTYAMLKHDFPCKVVDYSTSKTGKHGHAKAHIVGIDIFTGKKVEDICPASHNMDIPFVKKHTYTVMDVPGDGTISLLTEAGEPKDDLNMPTDTEGMPDDIANQIQKEFDEGKALIVTTIAAMGKEKIIGVQEEVVKEK